MSYTTREELESVYGEQNVADLLAEHTSAPLDLTLAQAAADSTINRHLRGRYAIPFVTLPDDLKSLALTLTWHALWLATGRMPEYVQKSTDSAIEELRLLASGKTVLAAEVGLAQANLGGQIAAPAREMAYTSDWVSKYSV